METTVTADASLAGRIQRLPELVINRIAAGEIVLRPSAALKELLENSLDAGARHITVSVRGGGMSLLRVTDDGAGILHEDLPLLCHRFATSKLRTFDDLRNISTFGFRGEALASVSHVARVSVVTKTADAPHGYSAAYLDGKLRGEPKATGATEGTSLSVEDLFYNLGTRRNALKATGEEYRTIVDVVARYAIRYPHVAFVCKKLNEKGAAAQRMDVRTSPDASGTDNIRAAFGSFVSQELISVGASIEEKGVQVESLVTKATFSLKKRVFILFINGRLVECAPLRRAIAAAYSGFQQKGSHPFAYVNIQMRQEDIDVNVHPTKKEVRFLHETEIIDAYIEALSKSLSRTDQSRTFMAQTVLGSKNLTGELTIMKSKQDVVDAMAEADGDDNHEIDDVEIVDRPYPKSRFLDLEAGDGSGIDRPMSAKRTPSAGGAINMEVEDDEGVIGGSQSKWPNSSRPASASAKVAPQNMVRTGPHMAAGVLDSYFTPSGKASPAVGLSKWRRRRTGAPKLLTSITNEMNNLRNGCNENLREIFKEHSFIGIPSPQYALVQYKTKIMIVEIAPVIRHLMYRQILTRFEDFDVISVQPQVSLSRLLKSHFKSLSAADKEKSSFDTCMETLVTSRALLREHFSIDISCKNADTAQLVSLPLVLPGVMPNMAQLPRFLYEVATKVDWSQETTCLLGIASLLADLYAHHWVQIPEDNGKEDDGQAEKPAAKPASPGQDQREWLIRHIFFESLRVHYDPPQSFVTNDVIREITSTAKLYKIFERC